MGRVTTALVDADSLLYRIGFAVEEKLSFNQYDDECDLDDIYVTDIRVLFKQLDETVTNIKLNTDCDDILLVFSGKNNFRFEVDTTYKHNRINRKPSGYQEMLDYLVNTYNSYITDGYEADDYVVYLKSNHPTDYVLCAIDKDVLYQTVGTHYNYTKQEFITVTKEEADRFFWYQVLVGDITDGYKGLPKCGKVTANRILDEKTKENTYRELVLNAYESKGFTEEYMVSQMQLASMHQLASSPDGIGLRVQLVS